MTGERQPPPTPVVGLRQYPAEPSSVRAARHDAADAVRGCGLGEIAETVALLVSELVTNAVEATGNLGGRETPGGRGQMIALRLAHTAASLVVEVWDGEATPPALAGIATRDAPDAEGGRGLVIVDTLCTAWGWYHPSRAGGKVVWCANRADTPVPASSGTQDTLPRRASNAGHAAPAEGRPAVGDPAGDPADVFDDNLLRRAVSGRCGWDRALPLLPAAATGAGPNPPPCPRNGGHAPCGSTLRAPLLAAPSLTGAPHGGPAHPGTPSPAEHGPPSCPPGPSSSSRRSPATPETTRG